MTEKTITYLHLSCYPLVAVVSKCLQFWTKVHFSIIASVFSKKHMLDVLINLSENFLDLSQPKLYYTFIWPS